MAKEFYIHFENRTIALVEFYKNHFTNSDGLYYSYSTIEELSKVLDFFKSHKVIQNVFLIGKPTDVMLEEISRFFQVITAAGGLVHNSKGEVLMINRKGHWDLPKGKPETGETVEDTALREVSEETGLSNLKIMRHIYDSYHTYQMNELTVLKRTCWFEMDYSGCETLKPQFQEEIIEAKWISKDQLEGYLDKSYKTIKEVFTATELV